MAVREFYKFAAAEQFVDGSVLAALYQVADSRHLPAHLSVEGAVWATSPGRGTGSNLLAGRARTTWFGRSPGCQLLTRSTASKIRPGTPVTFAQLKRGGHDRAVGWSQSSATLERHQGHRRWGTGKRAESELNRRTMPEVWANDLRCDPRKGSV